MVTDPAHERNAKPTARFTAGDVQRGTSLFDEAQGAGAGAQGATPGRDSGCAFFTSTRLGGGRPPGGLIWQLSAGVSLGPRRDAADLDSMDAASLDATRRVITQARSSPSHGSKKDEAGRKVKSPLRGRALDAVGDGPRWPVLVALARPREDRRPMRSEKTLSERMSLWSVNFET